MTYRLLLCTLLVFYSIPGSAAERSAPVSVHLYTWWDYVTPAVIERLGGLGYQTKITVYKSNEVAVSRLSARQHDFDIAIVSNFALPYLMDQGLIETNQFQQVTKRRRYLPLFADATPHCLPFFWLSTVFVADEKQTPNIPGNLQELVALKKQGYKIGVVDDPYETAARLIGDEKEVCGKSPADYLNRNIFDILSNCPDQRFTRIQGLEPSDFVSSIDDLLKQPKMAMYTWHGTAFMRLPEYPSLRAKVPAIPVVGYDAVCIVKKNRKTDDLATLVKYVEVLTDKSSTELNMRHNQYFSPYPNHTLGLTRPAQDVYKTVTENLKQQKPIILEPPRLPDHLRLNEWWRSVRYAS